MLIALSKWKLTPTHIVREPNKSWKFSLCISLYPVSIEWYVVSRLTKHVLSVEGMLHAEEWLAHWFFVSGAGVSPNQTLWGYHDSRISYVKIVRVIMIIIIHSIWWEINTTSHVWLSSYNVFYGLYVLSNNYILPSNNMEHYNVINIKSGWHTWNKIWFYQKSHDHTIKLSGVLS